MSFTAKYLTAVLLLISIAVLWRNKEQPEISQTLPSLIHATTTIACDVNGACVASNGQRFSMQEGDALEFSVTCEPGTGVMENFTFDLYEEKRPSYIPCKPISTISTN